jgi:hypothetical protein
VNNSTQWINQNNITKTSVVFRLLKSHVILDVI